MMKKCTLSIFCVIILLIASCSKNESPEVKANPDKLEKRGLGTPLEDGRTEVEAKASGLVILSEPWKPTPSNIQQYDIPDAAYIKATCLIDISKLKKNAMVDTITDKVLGVKFGSKLRKLNGFPDGWTAKWNVKPHVEQETPPVLYTVQKNHLSVTLSKPCTIFGFELAPNLYDTFEFAAGFYNRMENPPYARVIRQVTTPLGALLFAVKSDKPFDQIEIQFTGDLEGPVHPFGFALANIRYKLAK
jgi:hypothetical protein